MNPGVRLSGPPTMCRPTRLMATLLLLATLTLPGLAHAQVPQQWWRDATFLSGGSPSFTVDQTGVIHATTYGGPLNQNTYWRRADNCHWEALPFMPKIGLTNDQRPQGYHTSVAMGADGQPYILYLGHTTMSSGSGFQARVAHFNGAEWSSDSLGAATENQVSIRVAPNGKLHVIFVGSGLEYATNESGAWVTTDLNATGYNPGQAGHAMAVDASGNVHVAYCIIASSGPSPPHHLGYLKRTGGAWSSSQTLDSSDYSGQGPGISIGADGEPVISHNSLYNLQTLRHTTSGWVPSVVLTGSDTGTACMQGTAICHDQTGRAHVAAYCIQGGASTILYWRGDGAGGWSDTVTAVPGLGTGGAQPFNMLASPAGYPRFLAPAGANGIEYVEALPGAADTTPPAAITNLAVQVGDSSAAALWTAPGDDANTGQATNYDVRFAFEPITDSNFALEQQLPSPCPGPAGSSECVSIQGLTSLCSPVYFAVKTRDESGNWSAISNVASKVLKCHPRFPIEVQCSNGYRAGPAPRDNAEAAVKLWIASMNPARGTVSVEFSVPAALTEIRLGVHDVAGRLVRSLGSTRDEDGGGLSLWDLTDDNGTRVRPGIYYVRIEAAGKRATRAVVVLE